MTQSTRTLSLGLAVLVLAAFGQALTFDFVHLDDNLYVTDNPHLMGGLTWDGIRWAFRADLLVESPYVDYWQPVTILSRLLDVEIFGMRPAGHHLTSILIHTVNAVLLFGLLYRLTGAAWPSFFAAAVFAIHPLRIESVVWIVERKDVLAGLFWLLALRVYVSYVDKPSRGRYLAVFVLMALGLMAKPLLVTLPVVLILIDIWPLRRIAGERGVGWGRIIPEKLPLLGLAATSCWITFHHGQILLHDSSWAAQILNAPASCLWYIWKFLWPLKLAAFYPHTPGTLMPIGILVASWAGMAALTVAAITQFLRRPFIAVGWLWFLVTLLPMVVGATHVAVADRFSYIPHVGLCILAVWGCAELTEWRGWGRTAVSAGSAAVVVILLVSTLNEGRYWKNSHTLFDRILIVTENNSLILLNKGTLLLDEGKPDEAISYFNAALKILPSFSLAHYNLANALSTTGHVDKAVEHYLETIRLEPGSALAHHQLAVLYEKVGRMAEAAVEFREAERIDPELVRAILDKKPRRLNY